MKHKASVRFGAPVYLIRKIVLPYFVMLAAIVALFFGPIIKEGRDIFDLWFDSIATAIALLGFPVVALITATILFFYSVVPLHETFQKAQRTSLLYVQLSIGYRPCAMSRVWNWLGHHQTE